METRRWRNNNLHAETTERTCAYILQDKTVNIYQYLRQQKISKSCSVNVFLQNVISLHKHINDLSSLPPAHQLRSDIFNFQTHHHETAIFVSVTRRFCIL